MDLTPELLRTVEFHDAKKGGYDHDEVDEFLDRAAADLARQHAHLREIESRAAAAEHKAAELESRSEQSDADETLRRTLVLAQRTADAAVKEAQEEAGRIVAEARQKAEAMITSAEEQVQREVGATRDRLEAEIRELETRRAEVGDRIKELSGHLDGERDRLREQLEHLRETLDGDSLRVASIPGGDDDLVPPAPPADEPTGGAAAEPAPEAAADEEDLSELPPPPIDWAPSESSEPEAASSLFGGAPSDTGERARLDLDLSDSGPPTEASPAARPDAGVGAAHIDELRRAVSDGSTPEPEDDDAAMAAFFDQDDDEERSRRFGRRR